MFGKNILTFRLFGIDVKLHWSWLLIFLFFTWTWSSFFEEIFVEDFPGFYANPSLVGWLAGAILTMIIFASIIAHELAHSLMARRLGFNVREITPYLLGGVSYISENSGAERSAASDFKISIVGPLSSFALALLFWLASKAISPSSELSTFIFVVLEWLAVMNLVLAIFNMLPAHPLDGGRIFVAFLRLFFMGSWQARKVGSTVGMAEGFFLITLGVLLSGILFILIGVFLIIQNKRELIWLKFEKTIEGVKVSEVMSSSFGSFNTLCREGELESCGPDDLVTEVLHKIPRRGRKNPRGEEHLFVVDEASSIVGTLSQDDLEEWRKFEEGNGLQ